MRRTNHPLKHLFVFSLVCMKLCPPVQAGHSELAWPNRRDALTVIPGKRWIPGEAGCVQWLVTSGCGWSWNVVVGCGLQSSCLWNSLLMQSWHGWGFSTEAPRWVGNWLMRSRAMAVAASGLPWEKTKEAREGVRRYFVCRQRHCAWLCQALLGLEGLCLLCWWQQWPCGYLISPLLEWAREGHQGLARSRCSPDLDLGMWSLWRISLPGVRDLVVCVDVEGYLLSAVSSALDILVLCLWLWWS